MKTFKANNPNIIYIGSWTDQDSAKLAKFNFCKFFVLFKGAALKVNADAVSAAAGTFVELKRIWQTGDTVTTSAAELRVEQTESAVEIKVNNDMIFVPYFQVDGNTGFHCCPIIETPQ